MICTNYETSVRRQSRECAYCCGTLDDLYCCDEAKKDFKLSDSPWCVKFTDETGRIVEAKSCNSKENEEFCCGSRFCCSVNSKKLNQTFCDASKQMTFRNINEENLSGFWLFSSRFLKIFFLVTFGLAFLFCCVSCFCYGIKPNACNNPNPNPRPTLGLSF